MNARAHANHEARATARAFEKHVEREENAARQLKIRNRDEFQAEEFRSDHIKQAQARGDDLVEILPMLQEIYETKEPLNMPLLTEFQHRSKKAKGLKSTASQVVTARFAWVGFRLRSQLEQLLSRLGFSRIAAAKPVAPLEQRPAIQPNSPNVPG